MNFTIGADPEIFVKKNGRAISAYGLVEGTKKEPKKTSVGAYQVDGMALEFNIDPVPLGNFDMFNFNIVKTIEELRKAAGDVNFNISSVQEFSEELLNSQPDEAKELGCDPDYNAYTGEENPMPDGTRLFRTGAGHIHFGWGADIPVDNEEHFNICAGFVKMLDLHIGMYMTLIDRDPRRRELYGKAGAFRPKPYGVEYRTPSNVWLKNKHRRYTIHRLANLAVNRMKAGKSVYSLTALPEESIQRIIDTGHIDDAKAILNTLLPYGRSLYSLILAESAALDEAAEKEAA